MTSILLVHGAWMGGWAWDRVAPILRARGHQVSAPDLLGYGAGDPPAGEVTRPAAIERLRDELASMPGPVVVVGHSLGGTVISELAEAAPESVSVLVYVAAYLLGDGQSVSEVSGSMQEFWTSALAADGAIQVLPEQGGTVVNPDMAVDAFVADADADDQAWAAGLMHLDPFAYGGTPLRLTDARWGSVRRVYVETLDDHAVPVAAQRAPSRMTLPAPDQARPDAERARHGSAGIRSLFTRGAA